MATPASLVRTAHPLSARPAAVGGWWRPGAVLRVATRLLVVAAGLLVAWLVVAPAAMAEVAPTGAFQTSVAIKVPPFHGLEPRLGLAYSSSGSNGWIGAGWSLTGLSTIQRRSTDRGIPRWDATDRFLLDGQDLLACPAKDPTKDDDSGPRVPQLIRVLGRGWVGSRR